MAHNWDERLLQYREIVPEKKLDNVISNFSGIQFAFFYLKLVQ